MVNSVKSTYICIVFDIEITVHIHFAIHRNADITTNHSRSTPCIV